MGLAIIGVLSVHLYYNAGFPRYIRSVLWMIKEFCPTSFFFILSGYGLFHSLYTKRNVKDYYIRRFSRLYIPYLLLVVPFAVYDATTKGLSWSVILGRIFCCSLFIEGNYLGMWFINCLLPIVLMYPLFFLLISKIHNANGVVIAHFACVFIALGLRMGLPHIIPNYNLEINYVFASSVYFIIGSLMCYLLNKKEAIDITVLLVCIGYAFWMVVGFCFSQEVLQFIQAVVLELVELLLLAKLLNVVDKLTYSWILNTLRWLGLMTLEIYFIHLVLDNVLSNIGMSWRWSMILGISLAVLLCKPIHMVLEIISSKICSSIRYNT